jgi:hypothetical protein
MRHYQSDRILCCVTRSQMLDTFVMTGALCELASLFLLMTT